MAAVGAGTGTARVDVPGGSARTRLGGSTALGRRGSRTRQGYRVVSALTIALSSAFVLVALLLPPLPALRSVAVLSFWILGIGGVAEELITPRRRLSITLRAAYGVSIVGIVSQLVLLLGLDLAWALNLVAAGGCLLYSSVRVGRLRRALVLGARRTGSGGADLILLLLIVLGGALAVAVLQPIQVSELGDYGLLPVLPGAYYLGLAVVVVGTVLLICSPRVGKPQLGAVGIGVLALLLYGAPGFVYELPRYAWTYKHLGTIDVLDHWHRLPRNADIYFNWPNLFTTTQWFAELTGVPLTEVAKWAPVLLACLLATSVALLTKMMLGSARMSYLTALLFTAANWVGQDYLAPQPLALFLALVFLSQIWVLRHRWRTGRPIGRRRTVGLLLLWTALVFTHQLTPVIAFGWLLVLRLLLRTPPWRWLITFGLIEFAWVMSSLPYLMSMGFDLFSLDLSASSQASILDGVTPSTGARVRTVFVYTCYFGLFGAAFLIALRHLRRGGLHRVLAGFVAAPVLIVLVQDYGGEGRLRLLLVALPFLLMFVVLALRRTWRGLAHARRLTAVPPRQRVLACLVLTVAMTGCFLPNYLGQDRWLIIGPGDLGVTNRFMELSPPTAQMIPFTDGTPIRADYRYLDYMGSESWLLLMEDDQFRATSAPERAAELLAGQPPGSRILLTESQVNYMAYFGLQDVARTDEVIAAFDSSELFQVDYADGRNRVWSLRGAPVTVP